MVKGSQYQIDFREYAIFFDSQKKRTDFVNAAYVAFNLYGRKFKAYKFPLKKGGYTWEEKEDYFWTYYTDAVRKAYNEGLFVDESIIEERPEFLEEIQPYEKTLSEIIGENQELERKLYEDLLKLIKKEEPEFGKELYQEFIEELLLEEFAAESLSDILKDKEKIKGDFSVEEKTIKIASRPFTKLRHKAFKEGDHLLIEKFYYTLDPPVEVEKPTHENLMFFFQEYLEKPLIYILDNLAQPGMGAYIFRMTYWYKDGNSFYPDGMPVLRYVRGEDFETTLEYVKLVKSMLDLGAISDFISHYLKLRPEGIILSGFTLENAIKKL